MPNGSTYDGHFLKGLPNTVGVMRFSDSSRYEGKIVSLLPKVLNVQLKKVNKN